MKKIAVSLLLALAVPLASCASTPKPLKAAGSAFVACAKGDAPSVSAELLSQVQEILLAGAAGWEGMLEQLGKDIGQDVIACAVEAAEAGFAATSGGSAASTGDSPEVVANAAAAARAEQYLKTHGY